MFKWINNIIKFLVFVILVFLVYLTYSDLFMYTTIYKDIFYELSYYQDYLVYIGVAALIYIFIIIFSLIEKLFKKERVVKSKGESGEVEVSLDTINDISKKFLESRIVIKAAKINSFLTWSKVDINGNVETYNVENLNNKLSIIQNELREYILLMTGVIVKNINLKIVKINSETVIETTELEDEIPINILEEEVEDTLELEKN